MKTPTPFLSLDAHGSLGRTIVARANRKGTILQKHPDVTWQTSPDRTAYADFLRELSAKWTNPKFYGQWYPFWQGYPNEFKNSLTPWANLLAAARRVPNQISAGCFCYFLSLPDFVLLDALPLGGTSFLDVSEDYRVWIKDTTETEWHLLTVSDPDPTYLLASYTMTPGQTYQVFASSRGVPISPMCTPTLI